MRVLFRSEHDRPVLPADRLGPCQAQPAALTDGLIQLLGGAAAVLEDLEAVPAVLGPVEEGCDLAAEGALPAVEAEVDDPLAHGQYRTLPWASRRAPRRRPTSADPSAMHTARLPCPAALTWSSFVRPMPPSFRPARSLLPAAVPVASPFGRSRPPRPLRP